MSYNTKNYRKQGGESWVVDGTLTVNGTLEVDAGATVTGLVDTALLVPASASALGGIKAATKGAGDTVECKIDATSSKLYVAPPAAATSSALGGIKAAEKGAGDTVECKIDTASSKLYVAPAAGATADAAGVVKMAANQADSTAAEVADLLTDFNALLAKLKAAGVMVDDA